MASKVARNGEQYQNTREAKGKARVASDEDHHSRGEDHSSPWRAMNLGSDMMHFLHENHHLTRGRYKYDSDWDCEVEREGLKLGLIRITSLELSNNPKTRRVYSLMFIVDIEKKKKKNIKVRSKLIGSLSGKQKAAKVDPEGWHGRVAGGTGRAKSMTWGKHIFVPNLRILSTNQLQILFLLLQD
ncbi:hypothetical protein MTR_3g466640 [Medicago truncatula]|uniref:Uncharacterized protein n=1 Tax=Medicago truncatula TaxID=3880 RepID=A0A072UZB3_MEDTR|nr:hypothetical protein MTR_3g466640 [Medicago truncatula]